MPQSSFFNRIPFFIRLFNWEYWPANVVYTPVVAWYCWFALKARSFFFFSASNPGIETGGMLGESKWDVFKLLPKHAYPLTVLVEEGTTPDELNQKIKNASLTFPMIAKPDSGERGWLVKKLENEGDLKQYASQVKIAFLLQAYIDLPLELSIFYYRLPGYENGIISSMVRKEMLAVTGDGHSALRQLIHNYPRALLQLPVLEISWRDRMNWIPAAKEEVMLVPIGNHSKGAKFVDACDLIDAELTKTIDELSKQIPGFYYGRFDLRCASIESLKEGRNYQVMELNGCGAEPAHVYNPGSPLLKAYPVLFHHIRVMYLISTANHKRGVPYMSLKQFLKKVKWRRDYIRRGESAIIS
jgi:hypothetical protein